ATVSSDSRLRLYEAIDPSNPSQWTLIDEFSVLPASSTSTSSPSYQGRDVETPLSLSWCGSRFHPAQLVVGCGREAVARIWRKDPNSNRWHAGELLSGHGDAVLDVAWAPNVGRSYHLIATTSRDHHVRIFKLTPEYQPSSSTTVEELNSSRRSTPATSPKMPSKYRVDLVMDDSSHAAE
ncbi:epoxide hydrolase, soluble (sEH), partial [Gonapodya sp. JEL0774]